MRKNIIEHHFRSTDTFRRNYLRYEMTKISGIKNLISSIGWKISISNNGLNNTEIYSK